MSVVGMMIKLCTYELYTSISVLKFISDPVHTLRSGCMHGCSHGKNAVNKFGFFFYVREVSGVLPVKTDGKFF